MVKTIALITTGLLLAGCNGTVADFVRGAPPRQAPPASTPPPVSQNDSNTGFKTSPGRFDGSGGGYAIRANITTTDKLFSAGDYSARLTLSRTRGKVQ